MVLCLASKLLIYFELCIVSYCGLLPFFCMWMPSFLETIYWKDFFLLKPCLFLFPFSVFKINFIWHIIALQYCVSFPWQQNESDICIHKSSPFWFPFLFRLLQIIEWIPVSYSRFSFVIFIYSRLYM